MRVLVVEDEKRLAANIARGLREGAGYAVDHAADGEEALFMPQLRFWAGAKRFNAAKYQADLWMGLEGVPDLRIEACCRESVD